ncbi:MAG: NifB/NifX family molybdenum-iron cluster-binding protein [Intestinibaculum porci]|uniref:NifB/NifX family molybdenum-iron cluster-binding protein n=1 Tax=Intestinibaculum porci TaxID=2487118 RepID=UPI003F0FECC1
MEDGKVVNSQVVSTNGQGHGALVGFLADAQVDVLICGGLGMGAQNALKATGITLLGGVSGAADEAVEAYLKGDLSYDPDAHCDHHSHEHGCEEHTCHD